MLSFIMCASAAVRIVLCCVDAMSRVLLSAHASVDDAVAARWRACAVTLASSGAFRESTIELNERKRLSVHRKRTPQAEAHGPSSIAVGATMSASYPLHGPMRYPPTLSDRPLLATTGSMSATMPLLLRSFSSGGGAGKGIPPSMVHMGSQQAVISTGYTPALNTCPTDISSCCARTRTIHPQSSLMRCVYLVAKCGRARRTAGACGEGGFRDRCPTEPPNSLIREGRHHS